MDFDNKFDKQWRNTGEAPADSTFLETEGFKPKQKPPAQWFNWFWSKVIAAITEIQSKLSIIDTAMNRKANQSTGDGGFVGGSEASVTATGAAVGNKATATNGGAVGSLSIASSGGAVGFTASAQEGGAVGSEALATHGGAVGQLAHTINGGAVGKGATSGAGFSGGENAKTEVGYTPIDAIQLGTGTNVNEKTLQVYDYQLMDASGNIPIERLSNIVKVYNLKFPSITLNAQSTKDYTTSITISPSKYLLIRLKDGNTAGLTYVSGVSYYTYTGSNFAVQFNSDGTIHFANSGSSSVTISNLEFIVIEKNSLTVSEVTS